MTDPLSGLGETKYTGKFAEQGTAGSGFASDGPYHCEDCIHQVEASPSRSFDSRQKRRVAQDDDSLRGDSAPRGLLGRCYHPAVMNDPKVLTLAMPDGTPGSKRKQKDGSILVDIERECCRYVNQPARDDDEDED